MRARRIRPGFDTLLQRITPSDIMPVGGPPFEAPVVAKAIPAATAIITDLGPWMVTGRPQDSATNVLQPTVDPMSWGPICR